ncbi:MAG: hypothetical protein JJU02_03265 [Cryomorphaceae bacterium]|nr:hypothetical protein [Cryomorphaceae bacterium]
MNNLFRLLAPITITLLIGCNPEPNTHNEPGFELERRALFENNVKLMNGFVIDTAGKRVLVIQQVFNPEGYITEAAHFDETGRVFHKELFDYHPNNSIKEKKRVQPQSGDTAISFVRALLPRNIEHEYHFSYEGDTSMAIFENDKSGRNLKKTVKRNGDKTGTYEFLWKDGKNVRIDWFDKNGDSSGYVVHHYDGELKVKTEQYYKGKLEEVTTYTYDKNNQVLSQRSEEIGEFLSEINHTYSKGLVTKMEFIDSDFEGFYQDTTVYYWQYIDLNGEPVLLD